jgi:glycosyltransferase involved in cell wall biosynthesis
MRLTIVIPLLALTGGIKSTFELANQLAARGHQVVIVYPRRPDLPPSPWQRSLRGQLSAIRSEGRYWLARARRRNPVEWYDLRPPLVRVPVIADAHLPDADAVMACDWTTAYRVAALSPAKGRKFVYFRDYEIWSGSKRAVDAAWRLPLARIVNSTWLKQVAEREIGVSVTGVVVNGVDSGIFYPDGKPTTGQLRVGMLYHDLPHKGVADGLAAIQMARQQYPSVQLVMYGTYRPKAGLPPDVEFHVRPSPGELRRLYSSCDVWLNPSRQDGGPRHPMEAMACGCCPVTTEVGAINDYTVPGQTALVSPPGDVAALASNLLAVLNDEHLRQRIAQAGQAMMTRFTWERTAEQLEAILNIGCSGQSCT